MPVVSDPVSVARGLAAQLLPERANVSIVPASLLGSGWCVCWLHEGGVTFSVKADPVAAVLAVAREAERRAGGCRG